MSELYTIMDAGGYRLFLPPLSCSEDACAKRHRENAARNQAAIESEERCTVPLKPITGSFIYAHPPNYHGLVTLDFTKADWLDALGLMKRRGIDTVIFQASLWNELEECYYPSERFRGYRCWNVLEPMMEAVNELGLTLFLGGYGSVTCWRQHLDAGAVEEEYRRQWDCYRELLRYREYFDGFYFSPESAFSGNRNPEQENLLGDLYGRLFKSIRSADSSLEILMSPATFYYPEPGKMQEMADAWCTMFSQAHPDILAPQDSIGCGCITLDRQCEALHTWNEICKRCGIRFWSNVELFDACPPYIDDRSRCAAEPERVALQIAHAAPLAEKLIPWECLYYFSEKCPQGRPLADFLFGK